MSTKQYLPQSLYALENPVRAFAANWLSKRDFHYINFARLYSDGSCILLSNDHHVNDYLFETQSPIFAPVPEQLQSDNFFYLIPKEGVYSKVMHDVETCFNIKSAIDLFEHHHHYIDALCIGSNKQPAESSNVFLNCLDEISQFKRQLVDQFSDFFSHKAKFNHHKVNLPPSMQINQTFQRDMHPHVTLTNRESDCIACLKKGYTIKETAQILGISPRTVETYLNNLRKKFDCKRKRQLLNKIN